MQSLFLLAVRLHLHIVLLCVVLVSRLHYYAYTHRNGDKNQIATKKNLWTQFKQSRIHYDDVFIARIESKIYTMGVRLCVLCVCAIVFTHSIFRNAFQCVNVDNVNKIELCIFVCLHCIYCPSVQCQASGYTQCCWFHSRKHTHTFNGNFKVLGNCTKKGHATTDSTLHRTNTTMERIQEREIQTHSLTQRHSHSGK